jgi:proline iminopeptidase
MVAQGYAIRYPRHVNKLILVATTPSYRFIEEAKKILNERGSPKQIAACKNLWEGNFKNHQAIMRFFLATDSLYSMKTKKSSRKSYRHSKTTWSHEALNEGFSHFLRDFDFIPQLKRIICPTLILAGFNDWICPPSQAKMIKHHIPKAKLKIFKNCGHAIAIDAHEQYIKSIFQFLKK